MATTTNYGWTTPDNTALVKDGASAIRTLGSSVDTTVKALSPGTTAGDLDYYTSSTAKSRIGIGTNGQVLTSNGSIPSWQTISAGGMTLLSTTTLSGSTTTVSSISGSYKNLYVLVYGVTNTVSDNLTYCYANGSTTIAGFTGTTTGTSSTINNNGWIIPLTGDVVHPGRTSPNNAYALNIYDYASTANYKPISWASTFQVSSYNASVNGAGGIGTNSAITSLSFTHASGSFSTGTVKIYGVS